MKATQFLLCVLLPVIFLLGCGPTPPAPAPEPTDTRQASPAPAAAPAETSDTEEAMIRAFEEEQFQVEPPSFEW
ncbi:MAG: hypothetical protein GX803_07380 [Lentisphaerae bacterium]|nr:hypothetical protein [Lentisphaerota bacterium]